jgi:hypothetical protein
VLLDLRQAVRQVTLLNALAVPVRVSARPTPRLIRSTVPILKR